MGFFSNSYKKYYEDRQSAADWEKMCEHFYYECRSLINLTVANFEKLEAETNPKKIKTIKEAIMKDFDELKDRQDYFETNSQFKKNFMIMGMNAKVSRNFMSNKLTNQINSFQKTIDLEFN